MLSRRLIRIKVMQAVFSHDRQEHHDAMAGETSLKQSMSDLYTLYIYMMQLLVDIRKEAANSIEVQRNKKLATSEELNPNLKFVNNRVLLALENNLVLSETIKKNKLKPWVLDTEYPQLLTGAIREHEVYKQYMSNGLDSVKDDKKFLAALYREVIATNDQLYDYLEDHTISWTDDFPVINSAIIQGIQQFKPDRAEALVMRSLVRDQEDIDFGVKLYRKTLELREDHIELIKTKTPRWDENRLNPMDATLIRLALTEFTEFSEIPVKVSLNEYLEISKEYSTPKSSTFINGVLDSLQRDLIRNGTINKTGKGLM